MSFKYKLLKAIDTAGLNFLAPVVRLIYRDDPQKQLREIGQFIVVPTIAFGLFLLIWSVLAPKHKTKAGEVPTPAVVWDATGGIWSFHKRETLKDDGFLLNAEKRNEAVAQANARLGELEALELVAKSQLEALEADAKAKVEQKSAPAKQALDQLQNATREARRARNDELKNAAQTIAADDLNAKSQFLSKLAETERLTEHDKIKMDALKEALASSQEFSNPKLKQAERAVTLIAEERQFLTKYIDMLGANSREEKIAAAEASLNEAKAAFMAATPEQDLYKLAGTVLKRQELLDTARSSQYAKPWTLPKQIMRSLLCVFTGFLIASMIAIPVGILCGLSPTFMAAMTPFVALFKPVSPLVWLPIIMIIVGGFMPDPATHWLIVLLGNIPFIGDYKIDPMFISSAVTVALCSLWATLVNTALGVGSVDKDHMNVAKVLRLGFWARLYKIVIPTALPLIFAGLRISLGVGWMVLVAAEILSTSEGIGKFVNDMYTNGSSQSFAQMFVVVFIVGIIGMLLDRIMVIFQRLVSFDNAKSAI